MANEFVVRKGLVVQGPTTLTGDLSVSGNITGNPNFSGAPTVSDLNVTDDLIVGDDATIQGDLVVNGSFSFAGGSVFPDNTFEVQDDGDPSKSVNFSLAASTAATQTTIQLSQTANRIIAIPDASTTMVGHDTTQTLSNKTLLDSSTSIADSGDPSKLVKFDASPVSTATTRTLMVPDFDMTLVGEASAQTLTNKVIDADLNSISNIDDGNVKTGAAIDRAKLASGMANHVIINDPSGVLSSEQYLSQVRGGMGEDTSAYTGVVKAVAGNFSASTLVNADVDTGAAITRTKLAAGNAYRIIANDAAGAMSENAALTAARVVITDANGQLTTEAALAEIRGGTAQTSYTTGDTLYASASNTLSKRTIGTAGQISKTGDAGIPVWEDLNYPTQETRLFDDWHTDAVGACRWLDADTGTGVSATTLTVADTNHAGILDLNTGASATGAAIRYLGGVTSGSATAGFALGGGVLTFEWLARVEDLSTAGERYSLMLGLFDTATTQVNGVRFLYNDSVNAGNWTISAINASTVTNTDSGVAVVADTWYKLRAVVNAAGTSIQYFINGASVGTVTTNIPTASIAPRASMAKTVGTAARAAYVDYFRLYQRLTSSR